MTVGTVFTLFVVPVFYSLIAAQRRPVVVGEERDGFGVEEEELLLAGAKA
jgi:multidrug efflux pump